MVSGLDIPRARNAVELAPECAEQLVEDEALALSERRDRRRRKGVGNRRPRCQSCNKFQRDISRPCPSCGFLKDVGWTA